MIYELSITLANGDIDKIIVDEDGVREVCKDPFSGNGRNWKVGNGKYPHTIYNVRQIIKVEISPMED